MRISPKPLIPLLMAFTFILNACTPINTTPTPLPADTSTPSATAIPPSALTVCLGQEPTTLYPINNPYSSARTILSALYDGPIDTNSYEYQPVILETIPSLENGDAELFQVSVYTGDEVVNTDGVPVTLEEGIRIRPAGCRSDECAIEYDGISEIQMDQMAVTYRLLPDLLWSDGEPLTAQDSVYSYLVADSLGDDYLTVRTQSYEAADEQTVQWWGRPGFIDPTYVTNFYFPLPYHLWSDTAYDALADSESARLNPPGWGPYMIDEWTTGVSISLIKNPHYFRQSEGLPLIDALTFLFTPSPEDALAALLAGECDLIDSSVTLDGQVAVLQSLQTEEQVNAFFSTSPVMEQLVFGILPAEYDNGYNQVYDRPNYFADARVRQAVAMCIDRQAIVDSVLYGLSSVPGSYVPDGHPLFDASASLPAYDPAAGSALLTQAGWLDPDGDPTTPRQASAAAGVPAGTPFSITLITTPASQRLQVSSLLASQLADCGIQVEVQTLDQAELYAAGPDGPLFGRSFELAEYAMGSPGIEPPCEWFTSSQVPGTGNRWVGTNLSGFSDPAFDLACSTARQSLPDEPAGVEAYQQAQSLFAQAVPSLPLYWRIRIAASSLQVCGLDLDPTASSLLWNIESLAVGAECLP